MSVVSKNPFDLLGDDGESPSPAPAAKPAAAQPKASTAPTQQRNVPGAAPRGNANRGRGSYPARGGRSQNNEPRNTGPTSGEGVAEGMENAGGFDGERVPPPKKHHRGPDAHTKGPRENRPIKNQTSGGHTSRGAGNTGKARTPNFGAERRQFERRSGTNPDSQKKIEQGWGADDGEAELTAEQQGEKDAQDEGKAPQTPAADADAAGWGVAENEATVAPAAEPEEPEEVTKSYDEYLAERAAAQLAGIGKKEGRQVNSETLEGTQFVRDAVNDFFSGKDKATKARAQNKKEKIYIEVDGQFASPSGRGGDRGGERGRGGRGGARGGRGGDRGARGGAGAGRGAGAPRGRGAPRGAARGVDASDEKAFPALGA